MSRSAAIIAAVAVVAGLGAAGWYAFGISSEGDRFAECRKTRIAGGSTPIGEGEFTLTAMTGERMTRAEAIDGPALVYFGYTYCPDVCPVDTVRNADAVDILEDRGIMLKPVFISIDPARDDPKTLSDFVSNIHPRMLGLTGTEEEIAAVARDWRVYRAKQGDDPQDYLMDHSTFAYLVAPGYGMLETFGRDDSPEAVADRAACFIDKM